MDQCYFTTELVTFVNEFGRKKEFNLSWGERNKWSNPNGEQLGKPSQPNVRNQAPPSFGTNFVKQEERKPFWVKFLINKMEDKNIDVKNEIKITNQ